MRLDGTTLDVGDTAANRAAFGAPASARGANATGAFPQLRMVGLLETGTHVLGAAQLGAYATGEVTLAADVVPALRSDMLCLADRGFLGFDLWQRAAATGAALVWRAKASLRLPALEHFADGSYRSELRWNSHCRSADRTPIPVRVIAYTLDGAPDAATTYRLVTSILEPTRAPAPELAALYHERWEIETAFDEFKTHLRGAQRVLRSKTPRLVRQEPWGFLLAHFAIRALRHSRADARSLAGRTAQRARSRHALVYPCGTRDPPDAPPSGGPFPLRIGRARIRRFCVNSARKLCAPGEAAACRAASNAR